MNICPKCECKIILICDCEREEKTCTQCNFNWHVCQNGKIINLKYIKHSDNLPCRCEDNIEID